MNNKDLLRMNIITRRLMPGAQKDQKVRLAKMLTLTNIEIALRKAYDKAGGLS